MGNKKSKPKEPDDELLAELEGELAALEGKDLSSEEFDVVQDISYVSEEPPDLAVDFDTFYKELENKADVLEVEMGSLRVNTPDGIEAKKYDTKEGVKIPKKIEELKAQIEESESKLMLLEEEEEKFKRKESIPEATATLSVSTDVGNLHVFQKRQKERYAVEEKIKEKKMKRITEKFITMVDRLLILCESRRAECERKQLRRMETFSQNRMKYEHNQRNEEHKVRQEIEQIRQDRNRRRMEAEERRKRFEQIQIEERKRKKEKERKTKEIQSMELLDRFSSRLQKKHLNQVKLIKSYTDRRVIVLAEQVNKVVLWEVFVWIYAQHIWKSMRKQVFLQWKNHTLYMIGRRQEASNIVASFLCVRIQINQVNLNKRLLILNQLHDDFISSLQQRIFSNWKRKTDCRLLWKRWKFGLAVSRRERNRAASTIQAFYRTFHVIQCLQDLRKQNTFDFQDCDYLDEKEFVFEEFEDESEDVAAFQPSESFSLGSLISSSDSPDVENDSYGASPEKALTLSRPATIESIKLPPSEKAVEIDLPVRKFLEKPKVSPRMEAVSKDWGFEDHSTSKAWIKRQKRFKNKKKKKKGRVVPFHPPLHPKKRNVFPVRQNAWE